MLRPSGQVRSPRHIRMAAKRLPRAIGMRISIAIPRLRCLEQCRKTVPTGTAIFITHRMAASRSDPHCLRYQVRSRPMVCHRECVLRVALISIITLGTWLQCKRLIMSLCHQFPHIWRTGWRRLIEVTATLLATATYQLGPLLPPPTHSPTLNRIICSPGRSMNSSILKAGLLHPRPPSIQRLH